MTLQVHTSEAIKIIGQTNGFTNGHHDKSKAFWCRVHSIDTTGEDVRLLLRYEDQFWTASISKSSSVYKTARALTPETLVNVRGLMASDAQPPSIQDITEISVVSRAKPGLSSNLISHGAPGETADLSALIGNGFQTRLDNRILDARVTANAAVVKLSSAVFQLAVEYLGREDFCRIHTPALIGWEFPGDEHEQFSMNYFDKETAWLSQTGDVHLEMALAADFERVYDIHTVFRREEQVSTRHLTEFITLEIMWAFKRDWTEIMEFAEKFIISLTDTLRGTAKSSALISAARRLYPQAGKYKLGLDANGHILRLRFSEAKKILREKLGVTTDESVDVNREEEALLGRYLASDESTYGPTTDIFFLTNFPKQCRPYNVYASPENAAAGITNSVDIIFKGQELSTGYQCIHDYEELREAMRTRKHPIDPDSVAWKPFVEAHEVGMPPIGGIAIGLNRFMQGFLGAADIHETMLFPRDASRLRP